MSRWESDPEILNYKFSEEEQFTIKTRLVKSLINARFYGFDYIPIDSLYFNYISEPHRSSYTIEHHAIPLDLKFSHFQEDVDFFKGPNFELYIKVKAFPISKALNDVLAALFKKEEIILEDIVIVFNTIRETMLPLHYQFMDIASFDIENGDLKVIFNDDNVLSISLNRQDPSLNSLSLEKEIHLRLSMLPYLGFTDTHCATVTIKDFKAKNPFPSQEPLEFFSWNKTAFFRAKSSDSQYFEAWPDFPNYPGSEYLVFGAFVKSRKNNKAEVCFSI